MTAPLREQARLGVVVGKFLPPHRGHNLLIDTASAACDRVAVIVCARDDDPIPASVRVAMITEMHSTATVLTTPDDIPDHEPQARAEKISAAWADRTRALCVEAFGRCPDVVFSSEDYGPRFARHLGADHVSVDPARSRVPVSGTMVRSDPFAAWDFLHPVVRSWYARRVAVVGAESTGTTTLARDLAAHFGCPWVPEYGRAYCEQRLATGAVAGAVGEVDGIDWSSEDFVHIATRQLADEDAAARRGSRLVVCDTDALATSIWHRRYLGRRSEEVERLAAGRRYDLYLLTGDDIPFVQDGTRDGEHLRAWMTEMFREELALRPEPWLEVTGSRRQRLDVAVRAILDLS